MSAVPIRTPIEPTVDDLLLPFEKQNFPLEYMEYYGLKRNNFFATVQKFRDQWNYYLMLDQIWMQEFRSLTLATDPNTIFPITVYMNAHLKVRIAIELAFAGTLPEARSIMRDAVEYAAHAHHMLKDPALQELWLNKLDDQKAWSRGSGTTSRLNCSTGYQSCLKSGSSYRTWVPMRTLSRCANAFTRLKLMVRPR